MFPPSEPSDVKQDSKEQFKTKVTCFQPKLNSFPKFKWVENDLLKYIFKTLLVIWLTFYEKQNNGNLDVLKQDSYLDSLWLDYNNYITVHQQSCKPFLYFQTTLYDFPYPTSGMNRCL